MAADRDLQYKTLYQLVCAPYFEHLQSRYKKHGRKCSPWHYRQYCACICEGYQKTKNETKNEYKVELLSC